MSKRLPIVLCLLLLSLQLAIQLKLAREDSQTTDEAVHISAGYSYMTRGDFRYNPEHPPLVKELSAIPLLFANINQPSSDQGLWERSNNFFYDSWLENRQYGEDLLYGAGNDPNYLIFLARIPIVLLTLLLGLTIFFIVRKHWGAWPAVIATGVYVSNPIVNGHGHLVTTDITISLGYLLTIYAAWCFFERQNLKTAGYLGLAVAFSLAVKHTAIIIIPALFLLWLVIVWRSKQLHTVIQLAKYSLVMIGIIVVVLWSVFGFADRTLPRTSSYTVAIAEAQTKQDPSSEINIKHDAIYSFIRPILSVLPGDYVKGVGLVLTHTKNGQPSYLLGDFSQTGWWYYFPVLIFFKSPIPLLLLFIAAGIVFLKRRDSAITGFLIAGSLFFLLFAMTSKANLGVRHVLPFYPPFMVVVGYLSSINKRWLQLSGIALVWLFALYLVTYPSYLGYFNEFAGPKNSQYRIATDSNIDWGQDLKRIRDYLQANDIKSPYIKYDWLGDQALRYYLGNSYQHFDVNNAPTEGTIIVNVSELVQQPYQYLQDCQKKTWITQSVLACEL